MQECKKPKSSVWLRVCFRLLCGVATGAVLGLTGWFGGDFATAIFGIVLGLIGGFVYGERAMCRFAYIWFNGGVPPVP